MPMPPSSTFNRSVLNRVFLALGLFGILVVVHLGIQASRGFDQGCLGFLGGDASGSTFDCAAVLQTSAGSFLGISNTVWGFLFYGFVVVTTLMIMFADKGLRDIGNKARPVGIGLGFLYSLYLVYYQFAVIGELCALCLLSAALVLLLAIAVVIYMRLPEVTPHPKKRPAKNKNMKDLRFASVLVFLTVILAGADFLYFSALQPAGGNAAGITGQPGQQPACGYDPSMNPVDLATVLGANDPSVGNPDAAVTVVEFFDPNCPHCRTMHSIMEMVVEDHGDKAHFVYKPVALWEFSVPQIEALYLADEQGKFDEMLAGQFERQRQGGLSLTELQSIASDIDMDPDELGEVFENGRLRPLVMQQRMIASTVGLRGVPALMINGRFVGTRTAECIGQLIEEAAQ